MAAFALVLFLAGTNYCLVGDIASQFGAHISCMAPAKAPSGSCHETSGESHSAQAASPVCGGCGSSSNDSKPVRAATPPCCVALAPVVGTATVAIFASAISIALPVSSASEDAAPVPVAWHGHQVFRDTGPPTLHSRAPHSPRAPPLA